MIQKDVPAPEPRQYVRRLSKQAKADILSMDVGDSFVADVETARSAAAFAKRNGGVLTQAKQPDGTVRLWRQK